MKQAKKTFLVGFSGGADSTAALLWAVEHFPPEAVIAVHMNHHLRGAESDGEAENAARFAAARSIKFQLVDLDLAPGGNLEARARQARLEVWKKLTSGYEDAVVITGHHQDDCIENLFLRIGRGSNVSGLTGLQQYSRVDGVTFFRPLLTMSREEIETFLRERGVDEWATDSSNLNCDYARNVLRNSILPELYALYPGGRKAVVQTLSNLASDALYLDDAAREKYENAGDRYLVQFWQGLPEALLVRMLKLLCEEFFADGHPLSSGAIERFGQMVRTESSGICPLDGERKLLFAGGRIMALPEKAAAPRDWKWQEERQIIAGGWRFSAESADRLPEGCGVWEVFFDPDGLPDILTVTPPLPGEKMVPFGRKTPVLLKKLRVDAGIPAKLVPPVLKADGDIIWFPGVRRSNAAIVNGKSRIIRFFAEKSEKLSGKNL